MVNDKRKKRMLRKDLNEEVEVDENMGDLDNSGTGKFKLTPLMAGLIVLVVALGFLLFKNKDLFVAATVNQKPIFTWDLNSKLQQRYGKTTLEEMVNEKILLDEAAKKNIVVSQKEIDAKIDEVKKSLGAQMTLDDALKQQGMTLADFRSQIELRIVVDKLVGDKVKVTEKEISTYMEENKDNLSAAAGTDSAAQKKYAETAIKQQKSSTEFQKWFTDVKAKAKVATYFKLGI